jgi:uncharacterized SAM-binding protein YcdF (DUF218 family)
MNRQAAACSVFASWQRLATMLDYLLRQLLLLLQPVGLVWFTLLILTIVLWRKKRRGCSVTTGLLALLITICGSTDFPGWLLRGLERRWAGVKLADLPACDAVVVLGGGGEPSRYEAGGLHLTRAGDRFIMGVELMRLGKARMLCVGGNSGELDGEQRVEADIVKAWLESWKLPAAGGIISLGANTNTRDEAVKVAAIAKERGWQRVMLVTSASHMSRAAAVFSAVDVVVTPAPCNFLTTVSTGSTPFQLSVPSWAGFEKIGIWAHETAGWAIYKRRGWVK